MNWTKGSMWSGYWTRACMVNSPSSFISGFLVSVCGSDGVPSHCEIADPLHRAGRPPGTQATGMRWIGMVGMRGEPTRQIAWTNEPSPQPGPAKQRRLTRKAFRSKRQTPPALWRSAGTQRFSGKTWPSSAWSNRWGRRRNRGVLLDFHGHRGVRGGSGLSTLKRNSPRDQK